MPTPSSGNSAPELLATNLAGFVDDEFKLLLEQNIEPRAAARATKPSRDARYDTFDLFDVVGDFAGQDCSRCPPRDGIGGHPPRDGIGVQVLIDQKIALLLKMAVCP